MPAPRFGTVHGKAMTTPPVLYLGLGQVSVSVRVRVRVRIRLELGLGLKVMAGLRLGSALAFALDLGVLW